MYATYFNPSDAPFVLDDGTSIPGGEWGSAPSDDARVVVALAVDDLVAVERPPKAAYTGSTDAEIDPRAEAAFGCTDELNGSSASSDRAAEPTIAAPDTKEQK